MKNSNIKNKKSQQSSINNQTVAMIVYFNGNGNDHRTLWGNFDMDTINHNVGVYEKLLVDFPEFRSTLYDYILENSLLSNADTAFYSCVMTHICGDKSILDEILKYPEGGWAIIGEYNYDGKTIPQLQFLDPEEFKKHLKSDYTAIPFVGNYLGITLEEDTIICEDIKEGLFLSCLIELIKISDNSCCHFSNDELLRIIPEPLRNLGWIAKALGKFLSLGIIGILTYDVNGSIYYRDITQKHPAEHILLSVEQNIFA